MDFPNLDLLESAAEKLCRCCLRLSSWAAALPGYSSPIPALGPCAGRRRQPA